MVTNAQIIKYLQQFPDTAPVFMNEPPMNGGDGFISLAGAYEQCQAASGGIVAGDRVRSYDFDHRKDCYIEGVVEGFEEKEGCMRYAIRVDTEVFKGEKVTDKTTRCGMLCYPPVNGTPTTFGKICAFVTKMI